MHQIKYLPNRKTSQPRQVAEANTLESKTIANDIHSKLNSTRHKEIIELTTGTQVSCLLKDEKYSQNRFCIAGGKHAMGGQQFLFDGILLDTSKLKKVVDFCPAQGLLTVQSGMLWGDLVAALGHLNKEHACNWSIIQKPTGADNISIGGSLASNIHGRVLGRKPFIEDIEKFTAVLADGQRIEVSRLQNKELFQLAVGGYGMFCFIEDVTIRLAQSSHLQRRVELTESKNLAVRFNQLQAEGAEYGDFQFCIDSKSDTFLCHGILSAYFPIEVQSQKDFRQLKLEEHEWRELLRLAHIDKARAFAMYSEHYKKTHAQIYSSETFQLSLYVPDYHDSTEGICGNKSSEMITELYVPRNKLHEFLETAKSALREQNADVIYGTVRMIEKDTVSFLAWASKDFACVIFNLHVLHDRLSLLRARHAFRTLIDIALDAGGSYYLTYHRYATRDQLLRAYPQFENFVSKKFEYDPQGRFSSTWFEQMCLCLKSGDN